MTNFKQVTPWVSSRISGPPADGQAFIYVSMLKVGGVEAAQH